MRTNGKSASPTRSRITMARSEPESAKLAALIRAYAPHDGIFALGIPGLHVSRFSRISTDCMHGLLLPCLSIIAQGAKTVIVGREVYKYNPSRMLVYRLGTRHRPKSLMPANPNLTSLSGWTSNRGRLPSWS